MTSAIKDRDQLRATQEKFVLEEAQRKEARERGEKPWTPRLFHQDPVTSDWTYRHIEYEPYCTRNHSLALTKISQHACCLVCQLPAMGPRALSRPVREGWNHPDAGKKPKTTQQPLLQLGQPGEGQMIVQNFHIHGQQFHLNKCHFCLLRRLR